MALIQLFAAAVTVSSPVQLTCNTSKIVSFENGAIVKVMDFPRMNAVGVLIEGKNTTIYDKKTNHPYFSNPIIPLKLEISDTAYKITNVSINSSNMIYIDRIHSTFVWDLHWSSVFPERPGIDHNDEYIGTCVYMNK